MKDTELEQYIALNGVESLKQANIVNSKLFSQYSKLEKTLNARKFEPASPFLAQRIIANAKYIYNNSPIGLMAWLRGLFADFMMPRPIYAIAVMLVIGILIGSNIEVNFNDDNLHSQASLQEDEEML